jgi:hypothetical protein
MEEVMICINCDSTFHRRSFRHYFCSQICWQHATTNTPWRILSDGLDPLTSPGKLTASPRCFEHLAFGNINAALALLADTAAWWVAGKLEKFALSSSKTKSETVEMVQGIFTSLMGHDPAEVEQTILGFMRSDAFLGSSWTIRELRYFLYETLYGKCEDAGQPNHTWKGPALEASIRRGLVSLQHRGLVKKHTVPFQRWLDLPPETKWTLVDVEMNGYNAEIKSIKQVRKERLPARAS